LSDLLSDLQQQLQEEITRLQSRLTKIEEDAGSTEVLQMHQHRPLLFEALQKASSQVIIVSPWLNSQAVDYDLRQEIGNTLKRGVTVYIIYGFGDPDNYEKRTVEKLKQMASTVKKGHLRLHRVGDLHSKVLICDQEFMVLSSFNWLSFGGDPTRGNRIEDGILTRDKKAIRNKTDEWLDRIKEVPET